MKSGVISPQQISLDFEPGLTERYGYLRECVATGVYQRGLKRVAIDLDVAPSNLSVQLSEDPSRHFSVDSLERYIEATGDMTPIHYLAERFLSDRAAKQAAASAELLQLFKQLQPALKKAGLARAAASASHRTPGPAQSTWCVTPRRATSLRRQQSPRAAWRPTPRCGRCSTTSPGRSDGR